MDSQANVQLVMDAFRAVETRDDEGLAASTTRRSNFIGLRHCTTRPVAVTRQAIGVALGRMHGSGCSRLRPSDVLWHQRAKTPDGERTDTPEFGLYEVRDGKLARAQMFYFDPVEVGVFLERAEARAGGRGL
jgi:hypothetical protein